MTFGFFFTSLSMPLALFSASFNFSFPSLLVGHFVCCYRGLAQRRNLRPFRLHTWSNLHPTPSGRIRPLGFTHRRIRLPQRRSLRRFPLHTLWRTLPGRVCRIDASSWYQTAGRRRGVASATSIGLMRLHCQFRWGRRLLPLPKIRCTLRQNRRRLLPPYHFFFDRWPFLVVFAAAADWATGAAEAQTSSDFSLSCNKWSVWFQLEKTDDCCGPILESLLVGRTFSPFKLVRSTLNSQLVIVWPWISTLTHLRSERTC